MSRAPDWTEKEFETVLANPNSTPEQLSQRLSNRSTEAIIIVQKGIHAAHMGMNTSMLSEMMLLRLENDIQDLICPVCKSPMDK